jgi:rhodanese-related sulfurtransferase
LAFGAYAVSSNNSSDSKTQNQSPAQMTESGFSKIKNDLNSGAKMIDVRTSEEYNSGYIEQATNFSLQDMQAGKLPDLAKDTKIYVYCRSGNRSAQAKQLLQNAGFSNVVDLGGIEDVVNMGASKVKN